VPYRLRYHPYIKAKDIPKLNQTIRRRIKTAIEQRLLVSPEKYSEPLRRTLKGYRKLRVGDYRIVLKIDSMDILILSICHRKDVYERMEWRSQ
jgi:mRNA interferase RelE/StbE